MYQALDVEFKHHTATIWLARPDSRNAMDSIMIAELDQALRSLADDDSVQVVIVAGRGVAFCAGAPAYRRTGLADDLLQHKNARSSTQLLESLYAFPKPTVARIHGPCLATGMGLAAVCDIAVATRDATFGMPETRLGLIASAAAPYVLRAIGSRAARRWFLTGETFGSAEALRMGFVHDVCEASELDARIGAIAGSFMMGSPAALAEAKRFTRQRLSFEQQPGPSLLAPFRTRSPSMRIRKRMSAHIDSAHRDQPTPSDLGESEPV